MVETKTVILRYEGNPALLSALVQFVKEQFPTEQAVKVEWERPEEQRAGELVQIVTNVVVFTTAVDYLIKVGKAVVKFRAMFKHVDPPPRVEIKDEGSGADERTSRGEQGDS